MFDERQFIERVEAADPAEFRQILATPSADEERALRIHLGDARYQRMHGMALRRGTSRRAAGQPQGNVVVIHGVMGSELSVFDQSGDGDHLWINPLRIANGRLGQLQLDDDGRSELRPDADVRVTGILKRYYGELLLSLAESWNVRGFWFDWRKDLSVAAAGLQAQLIGWFDEDAPVHIVAHSMGGLVARTFIRNHPQRWESMWDAGVESPDPAQARAPGTLGGRLVMLGTPNHGSFAIPQAVFGLDDTIRKLALIDLRHNTAELLTILNSFVGSFQMLPSPIELPDVAPLYDPGTYGDLDILEHRLNNARKHHERLRDVVDPMRMVTIAGSNRPTYSGITDFKKLDHNDGYAVTLDGDGRVPHQLSHLQTSDGSPVRTYFVDEDHGGLPANPEVLASLDDVLKSGTTPRLKETATVARSRGRAMTAARAAMEADRDAEVSRLEALLARSRTWRAAAGNAQSGATRARDVPGEKESASGLVAFASRDEHQIEEILVSGVLTSRETPGKSADDVPFEPATIEIRVVGGGIGDLDKVIGELAGVDAVDAIAVGHYLGSKPESRELELDRAISGTASRVDDSDLLITQLSERGTIRGELGHTFFLEDPRTGKGTAGRTIAIAGVGVPGRFGQPEVTVMARELCWSLGRLGKRHLATVLIGIGQGNLSPEDAAVAWIHGIKGAITGALGSKRRSLRRITFVERDPDKIRAIQRAIHEEAQRLMASRRLTIDCVFLDEVQLARMENSWKAFSKAELESARRHLNDDPDTVISTRLTATLGQGIYSFGAIGDAASIPERRIPLDPDLVRDANDELAAAWDLEKQYERGQFLGQLLFPADFRPQLSTSAPLVLILDNTTARVHWEMVAPSDQSLVTFSSSQPGQNGASIEFDARQFLGTSRGVTRQLRTTFAPPPQPPPPPRRMIRVLVVADPAEDNRLPGAEAEGAAVADLFERFNDVHRSSENRVEVVRLLGPQEATRTNVLRQLILRSYDVLHFAGHCVYDREHPEASGWIFSRGTRITANELNRIDRVPGFIFSNACESGITPDRAELRSVELAPSFAESFFQRGVSNFVCTAWPVDDVAAQEFAITLYERLLGLRAADENRRQYDPVLPGLMHVAMREARLSIAATASGAQTWGAYQHYGNPYLRLFDPTSMTPTTAARDK
jgi:hypothetical protein